MTTNQPLPVQAQVETVTLFGVENPVEFVNPNSVSVSVLGINSEGETTYVEDGVMSIVFLEPCRTMRITTRTLSLH